MTSEILNLFLTASNFSLRQVTFLMAFPEWQVSLPGGPRPSQNDLFVLGKTEKGLVAMMIEGKVSEPFGPTLEEWQEVESRSRLECLTFLKEQLGLQQVPPNIRYQLLHRTASAVIEADRFGAAAAIMVIHSFSPMHEWFEDFQAFLHPYNVEAAPGQLVFLGTIRGIGLYSGWVTGEAKFLTY